MVVILLTDPKLFKCIFICVVCLFIEYVLSYLRTNHLNYPADLKEELRLEFTYFGLPFPRVDLIIPVVTVVTVQKEEEVSNPVFIRFWNVE